MKGAINQNPAPTASSAEVEARYSVSRRTVLNWIKAGCPVFRDKRENRFDIEALDEWLASDSVRCGSKYLAQLVPAESFAPPAATAPEDLEPIPKTVPENASAEELADMMRRLQAAERAGHDAWKAALKALRDSLRDGEKPDWSPAAVEQLRASWNQTVEARRKWEKDLPGILTEKGRYVDSAKIAEIIARAASSTASELDGVGHAVAGKILAAVAAEPASPERAVRDIVDAAVRSARRHLAEAFRQIAES